LRGDGSPVKKKMVPGSSEEDSRSGASQKPLLSIDLKFESLRIFLEHVQRALNQHAKIINTIQQDVKQKSYEKTLGVYLD